MAFGLIVFIMTGFYVGTALSSPANRSNGDVLKEHSLCNSGWTKKVEEVEVGWMPINLIRVVSPVKKFCTPNYRTIITFKA